ncbi:MAG: endolytic transglycosylase MltG [Alphaproteobacteria bacterium]|nr:endolytic transglycosylase MltG [Alphaproteobacteria bacterium]
MRAWIRRLGFAALAAAILAGVGLAILYSALDRPGPLGGPAIVVVPKGKGLASIADLLERHRVVASAYVLRAGVRLTGNQGWLRAGEYEFPAGISPRGVIEVLVGGRTVVRKLTIPEGATTAQALRILRGAYGLQGELPRTPEEGSLLPDTYHYSYGDQRHELVERMEQAMVEVTTRLWQGRARDVPLNSPQEAVILASIVERETALGTERPLIAGVFINRLKRDMALQSDPTVAYGVALNEAVPDRVLRRPLTRADLSAPSPYNTYANKGLPPLPIANPGRAALEAVLHPAATKALYFVADGNGGHVFSNTLAEHNRNVRRWRRILKRRRATAPKSGADPDGP